MGGFIKLHRKFLEWEWYDDINTKVVFLHMLLKANYDNKKWRGIEIKRGQFISSISNLADETGLSKQNIRTVLKKLKSTGEITYQSTNNYTIVTILNYGIYQDIDSNTNPRGNTPVKQPLTNDQQTTNNRLTTTQEIKELQEPKKEKNINTRTKMPDKIKYAEYVTMTNDEHDKLIATYGEITTAKMIETLDNYKGANGKKYASDYRAILNWVVEKVTENKLTAIPTKKNAEKKQYIKSGASYSNEDLFDVYE